MLQVLVFSVDPLRTVACVHVLSRRELAVQLSNPQLLSEVSLVLFTVEVQVLIDLRTSSLVRGCAHSRSHTRPNGVAEVLRANEGITVPHHGSVVFQRKIRVHVTIALRI